MLEGWGEGAGSENILLMAKTSLVRPTLCHSNSGTKCDRDKLNFSAEREGQSDGVEV